MSWDKKIGALVDGFTRISKVEYESGVEQETENHRTTILSMCRDIRALLIKLADWPDTMRSLARRSKQAQKKIAREARDWGKWLKKVTFRH